IVARSWKMVDNNGRVIGQAFALGAQVQAKLQIAMPLRAGTAQTLIHAQCSERRSTKRHVHAFQAVHVAPGPCAQMVIADQSAVPANDSDSLHFAFEPM